MGNEVIGPRVPSGLMVKPGSLAREPSASSQPGPKDSQEHLWVKGLLFPLPPHDRCTPEG